MTVFRRPPQPAMGKRQSAVACRGNRRPRPGVLVHWRSPKLLSGNRVPMARILLVEDDLDVCLVIEHALIDGGHAVDATGRVLAAFVLLGSHPFDLVVTDVRLPDGSGFEVADR